MNLESSYLRNIWKIHWNYSELKDEITVKWWKQWSWVCLQPISHSLLSFQTTFIGFILLPVGLEQLLFLCWWSVNRDLIRLSWIQILLWFKRWWSVRRSHQWKVWGLSPPWKSCHHQDGNNLRRTNTQWRIIKDDECPHDCHWLRHSDNTTIQQHTTDKDKHTQDHSWTFYSRT